MTETVTEDEDGMRLDRWFKRRYPELTHGRLEKFLRTGQVRVEGKRAKAAQRLESGQEIRIPPMGEGPPPPRPAAAKPKPAAKEVEALRAAILHQDPDVLILDKPSGLAVQGGTNTPRHLDAMLDELRFEAAERPRLVHRLDRDTSGVLVLARTAKAAAALADSFRHKTTRKVYWALVVGVPKIRQGRIELALAKRPGSGGEKVGPDEEAGKPAITYYKVIETAGKRVAWLALMPVTGRTHQLRAHCAFLGTPILGDGKYGGQAAFLPGTDGLSRQLHLHAREITMPHPRGGTLHAEAPLPPHMRQAWGFFGFDMETSVDPFNDFML